MTDRTLTTYDEVLAPQIGQTYTARIDRSAAGQPGIFFIIEISDSKTGEFLHENCVVIPDGREFLAPVNEWLRDDQEVRDYDLERAALAEWQREIAERAWIEGMARGVSVGVASEVTGRSRFENPYAKEASA